MYLDSKIIIQSDDILIKQSDVDIENCKIEDNKMELTILDKENIQPTIRLRRSFIKKISETTNEFKKLYSFKKDKQKQSESEYDIEAGIMLIKEIMKTNNNVSRIIYIIVIISLILFSAYLFMFVVKSFYDETTIE